MDPHIPHKAAVEEREREKEWRCDHTQQMQAETKKNPLQNTEGSKYSPTP